MRDGERHLAFEFNLHLSQLDIDLDGRITEASRWGALDITWNGLASVVYLNAIVDDEWCIRNAPSSGSDPAGALACDRWYVSLKTRSGKRITRARGAVSLTSRPLRSARGLEPASLEVSPGLERYYSDIQGRVFPPHAPTPTVYRGGPMGQVMACRRDMPNQDCGPTECGPAAVSNSLKWLKERYGLDVADSDLSLETWKNVLQWDPTDGGVPNGRWADLKARHIEKKKLPFTSRKFPGGHIRQATEEFARGQVVEIFVGRHIAALICMGQDANGNYWVNAASDTAQGLDGGAAAQPMVISPNGRVISGPPWVRPGMRVQNFVVQCPKRR